MRTLITQALPDNPVNLGFLLLCVGTFSVVLYAVLRPLDEKRMEREARLPLED